MCVEIHLKPGEDEIGTLGELRALVGSSNLKYYPGMKGNYDSDEQCLCGIDIDFTMQLAGYDLSWPDHRMWCEARKKVNSDMTPFEQGRLANAEGRALYKDNPFGPDRIEDRDEWKRGWLTEESNQANYTPPIAPDAERDTLNAFVDWLQENCLSSMVFGNTSIDYIDLQALLRSVDEYAESKAIARDERIAKK